MDSFSQMAQMLASSAAPLALETNMMEETTVDSSSTVLTQQDRILWLTRDQRES